MSNVLVVNLLLIWVNINNEDCELYHLLGETPK